MTPKVQAFAISSLRRSHVRWAPAGLAWYNARVVNPVFFNVIPKDKSKIGYRCNICTNIFRKKEVQLDHIVPVVDSSGFKTLDLYAERLYCEEDNYQVLCKPCHKIKSAGEAGERATKRRNK